jgi:hypothetical protein
MSPLSWKVGLAAAVIAAATAYAVAQTPSGHAEMHNQGQQSAPSQPGMHGPMHDRVMQMMHGGQQEMQGGMHGMMGHQSTKSGQPTLPGQDAFGAIQEVVQILDADPTTDWSKVNIAALREHLIDMNEVTLRAAATEHALENGIEIVVTGEGRTLEAIKRMVPAHVGELVKLGWNAKTEDLPNGEKLTVTTNDPKQTTKLKALGFMGLMVQGGHHQPHHLMMAKGEFPIH